ncbi:hypothetical protein Ahy_B05g074496 isoform B [Arachis hypogaea]|uniref:Uncharacterized protein n=1 Tax=Arachis hypogaea TaxID=3818 RepID=A0A444YZ13_ARAHY|nr:hypothetical protein Ahy_B05g074496 isoform B [Arachis hypogaea]
MLEVLLLDSVLHPAGTAVQLAQLLSSYLPHLSNISCHVYCVGPTSKDHITPDSPQLPIFPCFFLNSLERPHLQLPSLSAELPLHPDKIPSHGLLYHTESKLDECLHIPQTEGIFSIVTSWVFSSFSSTSFFLCAIITSSDSVGLAPVFTIEAKDRLFLIFCASTTLLGLNTQTSADLFSSPMASSVIIHSSTLGITADVPENFFPSPDFRAFFPILWRASPSCLIRSLSRGSWEREAPLLT